MSRINNNVDSRNLGLKNTRDFYKGKSFNFSGEWTSNTHYFNDEYNVDYVTWEKSLWVCLQSHESLDSRKPSAGSKYWKLVIESIKGDPGETPEFRTVVSDDSSDRVLEVKYGDSDWTPVGNVGGQRGFSPILKVVDNEYIA